MITIQNSELSTSIVLSILTLLIIFSIKKTTEKSSFSTTGTLELRGLAVIFVLFSHISHMLVTNEYFLYPLTNIAGVGSDLFLFVSGYWLTTGLLKKQDSIMEFYKKRMIKIFSTLWIVLIILFLLDYFISDRTYSIFYILRSFLGIFPSASGTEDVSSPMWYLSWLLMFYILLPLFFIKKRPWFTAIILALISNVVAFLNIFEVDANWLHQLHTNAFPIGVLFAGILFNRTFNYSFLKKGFINIILILILIVIFSYIAINNMPIEWPSLDFIDEFVVTQLFNLTMMFALISLFLLKRFDIKILSFLGVYSYEIYLIHWPLISKYDMFFEYFPAWAAVFLWMILLIVVAFLIKRLLLFIKENLHRTTVFIKK